MEGYPKKITLKNGKVIELRPLREEDEAALVKFFSSLPPESTQFLKHDVRDPEVVRRFIRKSDPDVIFAILALTEEGEVVGDATLHMSQYGWRRSVGEVRGVIAPEFRKQRLATALVHELVEHASLRGLKKLEAQILDSQAGALKVFKRFGFKEEARLKEHAADLHGNVHDVLILTNSVDDLWAKVEDMISSMDIARGRVM